MLFCCPLKQVSGRVAVADRASGGQAGQFGEDSAATEYGGVAGGCVGHAVEGFPEDVDRIDRGRPAEFAPGPGAVHRRGGAAQIEPAR